MITTHANLSTSALIVPHKRTSRSPSRAPSSPNFRHTDTPPPVPTSSLSSSLLGSSERSRSRRSSLSSATLAGEEGDLSPNLSTKSRKWRMKAAPGDAVDQQNGKLASAKRNQEFHALFRSLPEDDCLVDDFGCALQKEILLQGRLYISEHHICFNANIFGWVTNLVIAFTDITDITKRTTAIFIPNAIQISTSQCKYFFASFLSRDQAYDRMVARWQSVVPSSLPPESADAQEQMDDTTVSLASYDSDASSILSTEPVQTSLYSEQVNVLPARGQTTDRDRPRAMSEPHLKSLPGSIMQRFEKTECTCSKDGGHFFHTVLDKTYNSDIRSMHELVCNPDFLATFLTTVEKNTDVSIGDWTMEGGKRKSRQISYTKHLTNPLGPKSTRCLLKEEVVHADFDHSITHVTTTQTPDVPSGGSFCVRTRLCLMWAGHGQVRMLVTVVVDFSKSCWLKSAIEKASLDGQINYYKGFDESVRRHFDGNSPPLPTASPALTKSGTVKKVRHRRRRHHRHNSIHAQCIEEKRTERLLNVVLQSFSNGADWVMQSRVPSTAQIMPICFILLVLSNILIAFKLANVGAQLDRMQQSTMAVHQYMRSSRPLFPWLDSHYKHETGSTQHDEASPVDSHLLDLEHVIQQASESVDQMTKVVLQQRHRVLQQQE